MERREFIGTATRTGAVLLLAGGGALAACTDNDDATTGTGDTTPDDSPPHDTAGSTEPASTTTGPAVLDAFAFRLSTRNQRTPCNACLAHAAHRYFATPEAADAGRAHPGCSCAVVSQPVATVQTDTWFTMTGQDLFDDRWS